MRKKQIFGAELLLWIFWLTLSPSGRRLSMDFDRNYSVCCTDWIILIVHPTSLFGPPIHHHSCWGYLTDWRSLFSTHSYCEEQHHSTSKCCERHLVLGHQPGSHPAHCSLLVFTCMFVKWMTNSWSSSQEIQTCVINKQNKHQCRFYGDTAGR